MWGPGTNVAINNGGSLGGTGTIRVQGGIFFASPNTGSVLTSGASGNGHMVVEGHAFVVDNGLGVEDGYQVDVAAGGSLSLARTPGWRPARHHHDDPGRGHVELTGDGGFYRSSAAGQGALTNNGVLRKSGGTGTSVVDAAYSGSGQVVVQTGTLAFPTEGWSARSSRRGPRWRPAGAPARRPGRRVSRPRTPPPTR